MDEEKNCPFCGEKIKSTAKKCRFCGEWLDNNKSHSQDVTNKNDVDRAEQVRKGVTNSKFNEDNSGVLVGEIFIIAAIIGLAEQSWWYFGGILLGLSILLSIPFLGALLCILLSIAWGIIGFFIGSFLDSDAASWVIGIFAFIAGLAINLSGKQWLNDLD